MLLRTLVGRGFRVSVSSRIRLAGGAGLVALLAASPALADDVLHVGTANLDRPTVTALGVQLLITGDDNFNAKTTMRYRVSGTSDWRNALPLHRVHPEDVTGLTVPAQFAGSIFDLRPATSYDIELHASDSDGAVEQVVPLTAATRSVPVQDPTSPHGVNVTDAASLRSALNGAAAGDVITLANGTYQGQFAINASGTADRPVVIRGASQDGVVLDGGDCSPCNVLEVYGSYVHVERLTIQSASRALRFQGAGAEGNVVRRVHIKNVVLGIGSKQDQRDFYICDNLVEGRLTWPQVYSDDGGQHANDDGIHVEGEGHVVCHNQIVGFGDAMKVEQVGARANDFYGNEVLSAYDNDLELDESAGNARCIRNRFTNGYAPISFQPIYGGPAYAIRNVVVNVVNEQLKFHALGGTPVLEPSGMIVLHNTFVSPAHAINLQTSDTSHHFAIENNIFYGPASPTDGRTVDWTGPMHDALWDYDGFYPDGVFAMSLESGYQKFATFAQLQGAGVETHGILLDAATFASGLTAPANYTTALSPQDVTLAAASNAIDRGLVLPNINDGFQGKAPDLGALERGCPLPLFGVRPEGVDETNEPFGCESGVPDGGVGGSGGTGGAAGAGGAGGAAGSGAAAGAAGSGAGTAGNNGAQAAPSADSGCGCRMVDQRPGHGLQAILLVLATWIHRRRRLPDIL